MGKTKFKLESSRQFDKDFKKISKDKILLKKTLSTLDKLKIDPHDKSLKTHKVNLSNIGLMWSSRVTKDLRILWKFSKDNDLIILTIRLQGHDTVYN